MRSNHRHLLTLTTIAATALAAAGCGSTDDPPAAPPAEARQQVTAFLDALQAGRSAAACAQLSAEAQQQLRDAAWSSFRVHPGTKADRTRQVAAAHDRIATCAGAANLLAEETPKASLGQARSSLQSAPLAWFGPARLGVVAVGDEDWVVERHDGRWQITTVNGLPSRAA